MKDTNAPVESKCNGHRSPGGSVSYCFGHCQSVPVEKWPEQIRDWWYERYEFKLPEAARVELEHIVKEALQAARIEAKEEERKRIAEEVEKLGGYSNFKSAVLAIINNHQ